MICRKMAHNKPYRDIEERPRKKDFWSHYWHAITDNTKLIKLRKTALTECMSYSEGIRKLRMMKKLKYLLRRRKRMKLNCKK